MVPLGIQTCISAVSVFSQHLSTVFVIQQYYLWDVVPPSVRGNCFPTHGTLGYPHPLTSETNTLFVAKPLSLFTELKNNYVDGFDRKNLDLLCGAATSVYCRQRRNSKEHCPHQQISSKNLPSMSSGPWLLVDLVRSALWTSRPCDQRPLRVSNAHWVSNVHAHLLDGCALQCACTIDGVKTSQWEGGTNKAIIGVGLSYVAVSVFRILCLLDGGGGSGRTRALVNQGLWLW